MTGAIMHRWRRHEVWSKNTMSWGGASGVSEGDRVYDPRTRSWHKGASVTTGDWNALEKPPSEDNVVHWTEVDLFFTSRTPGITASTRATDPDGKPIIVAFDLELSELSQFTRQLKVTPSSESWLFLDDGRVLGLPPSAPDTLTHAPSFLQVGDLEHPAIRSAMNVFEHAASTAEGVFEETAIEGRRYWVSFHAISWHPKHRLWLGTVFPVDEGPIQPVSLGRNPWAWILILLAIFTFAVMTWLYRKRTHQTKSAATERNKTDHRKTAFPLSSSPSSLPSSPESIEEPRQMKSPKADRMHALGELSAGIAHDFNNVLMVVLTSANAARDALSDTPPDVHAAREELDIIDGSASSAARMTRQLMDFGRQSSGNPQPIAPKDELEVLSRLLTRLLPKTIQLNIDVGDDVGDIHLEPGHFEQLVMNLVVNARDAMPTGGVIELTLKHRAASEATGTLNPNETGYVVLRVVDTGEGMPSDIARRIFEPYFTTKSDRGGTGLGLATVYAIVKRAGGDIRLESQRGAGTAFEIWLPELPETLGARIAQSTPNLEHAETSTIKVLVCDDEEVSRLLVREILLNAGFQVVARSSPEEAIDASKQDPSSIDLLVTEASFDRMSGRRLLRTLRNDNHKLRAIILGTTEAYDSSGTDPAEPDMTITLPKPIDRATLMSAIDKTIGNMSGRHAQSA
jgi:signal transduction histidine kinase/ActR/RegA family two-component response regulator